MSFHQLKEGTVVKGARMSSLQPNPKNAPVCPVCKTHYVLAWSDNGVVAGMWLWKRDCKHRRAAEVVAGDVPEPKVWPFCSYCATRYVLRRTIFILRGGKQEWIWQRGCKHRMAMPKVGKVTKKSKRKK